MRAEFGYPIMVTPLSQFVGTQAAINVIVGERYKEVTDQVIQYALGVWGDEATEIMEPNVKDRILNRGRAKEWTALDTAATVRSKRSAINSAARRFPMKNCYCASTPAATTSTPS